MTAEDKRAAVGISITLSGQLSAAALAMLAIEGSLVVYILGSREGAWPFWLVAAGSAVAFIRSIIAGGNAVTAARNAGFEGKWDLAPGRTGFDSQAKSCLAGLVLFALLIPASGRPRVDDTTTSLVRIAETVGSIEARLESLEVDGDDLHERVGELGNELTALGEQLAEHTRSHSESGANEH